MRMIPGDVCQLKLAGSGAFFDQRSLDICRLELGLDEPIFLQFFQWVGGWFVGDFGTSMWTGKPVSEEIAVRFQVSLQIALMSTLFAVILSIPLGIASAVYRNTWIDYVVRSFSIAGIAMPSFWLGILIILGILITTQAWSGVPWMPPINYVPIWVDPTHNLSMLIWPALATGYRYSAVATRMTRSAMLDVLREDRKSTRLNSSH